MSFLKLKKLSEDKIICDFANSTSFPQEIFLGIGDDAAVLKKDANTYSLISKDLLLEDIHFRTRTSNATSIAIKSLNVNLSDIAAMGGSPLYVLLGISCPKTTSNRWLTEFSSAFKNHCLAHKIHLIGGDTTASIDKIVISVTILGQVIKQNLKLRSGAKADDIIVVTGSLGASAAGLYALEKNLHRENLIHFIHQHQNAQARILEGQFLGACVHVKSMMDLSDGINSDLPKLINSSAVGAEIEVTSLPLASNLLQFAAENKLCVYDLALGGGEDYELLFTIDAHSFRNLKSEWDKNFDFSLTIIGKIVKSKGLRYTKNGKFTKTNFAKFSHFL